jgi:hypothetical protein
MTNWKMKVATSVATATVLAAAIAPATFASTVKVHNNAKKSVNVVAGVSVKTTVVGQTNNNNVANLTGVFQNTGVNKSSDNTGKGDVSVTSGPAHSTVTNTTTTGGNSATVTGCGCGTGDDITVSGNGKKSFNLVLVGNFNTTVVSQTNNTNVVNGTVVAQNTGGNKANDNTGNGGVSVESGAATSTVTNTVTTGGNNLTL